MPTPKSQIMRLALNEDLQKSGPKGAAEVIDDAPRKTFTINKDGAILEFPHKQPDSKFWNGVKYYGSGKRSNIRIPRTERPEE